MLQSNYNIYKLQFGQMVGIPKVHWCPWPREAKEWEAGKRGAQIHNRVIQTNVLDDTQSSKSRIVFTCHVLVRHLLMPDN